MKRGACAISSACLYVNESEALTCGNRYMFIWIQELTSIAAAAKRLASDVSLGTETLSRGVGGRPTGGAAVVRCPGSTPGATLCRRDMIGLQRMEGSLSPLIRYLTLSGGGLGIVFWLAWGFLRKNCFGTCLRKPTRKTGNRKQRTEERKKEKKNKGMTLRTNTCQYVFVTDSFANSLSYPPSLRGTKSGLRFRIY